MSNHDHVVVLEHSLEQTIHWLDELKERFGLPNRHEAYSILRAVLHALRDRLPLNGIASLSSQLPLVVRGAFFEGWKPSDQPVKMDEQQFFISIAENMSIHRNLDPLTAAAAVIELMREKTSDGTMEKTLRLLPNHLREKLVSSPILMQYR